METEKRNRARMTAILALLTVILAVAAAGIGFLAVKKQKYEKQLSLGEKYLAQLDYENAEICFRKAISIEEKEAAPYLQLAAVYFVQERPEEAKEILEEGSRSVRNLCRRLRRRKIRKKKICRRNPGKRTKRKNGRKKRTRRRLLRKRKKNRLQTEAVLSAMGTAGTSAGMMRLILRVRQFLEIIRQLRDSPKTSCG